MLLAAWLAVKSLPCGLWASSEVKHDFGRWNLTCLKCHTTHPKTRVENEFSMDTTVGEFGIACESCHGPGEEHVRRNQDPRYRYQLHLNPGTDQSIVNPLKLPPDRASQICGQCHSIWIQSGEAAMEWQKKGFQYRPGDDLHRARMVVNKGVSSKHLQRVLLHPQHASSRHTPRTFQYS